METENAYQSDSVYGMGTEIIQQIEGSSEYSSSEIFEATYKRLREIESRLSFFLPDSTVSRLNKSGGKETAIDSDTETVLRQARIVSKASGGAFDITAAPLISLWRKHRRAESVPPLNSIKKAMQKIDYSSIEININSAKIKKGQMIDFGGIGKGYAADEIVKIYKKHGVRSAYINLGGNVLSLGKKRGGIEWSVGIQNPRAPRGDCIGVIYLQDSSIVTSGDYERCYFVDGIRYHHIIDTKSGFPAENALISATVVNPSSMLADAVSTAAFILGLEKGLDLISSFNNTQGVFITKDKDVYVTKGLKGYFHILDAQNYKFYYC
ncbi:MAG TPA: FAD:protein FMN transferase [Ruminiclostridium sp.]|nr:FAD:protein FMN transferase [Ruminiclostridium sp.]